MKTIEEVMDKLNEIMGNLGEDDALNDDLTECLDSLDAIRDSLSETYDD